MVTKEQLSSDVTPTWMMDWLVYHNVEVFFCYKNVTRPRETRVNPSNGCRTRLIFREFLKAACLLAFAYKISRILSFLGAVDSEQDGQS